MRAAIKTIVRLAKKNGGERVKVLVQDAGGKFEMEWTPKIEARIKRRRAERKRAEAEAKRLRGK